MKQTALRLMVAVLAVSLLLTAYIGDNNRPIQTRIACGQ